MLHKQRGNELLVDDRGGGRIYMLLGSTGLPDESKFQPKLRIQKYKERRNIPGYWRHGLSQAQPSFRIEAGTCFRRNVSRLSRSGETPGTLLCRYFTAAQQIPVCGVGGMRMGLSVLCMMTSGKISKGVYGHALSSGAHVAQQETANASLSSNRSGMLIWIEEENTRSPKT